MGQHSLFALPLLGSAHAPMNVRASQTQRLPLLLEADEVASLTEALAADIETVLRGSDPALATFLPVWRASAAIYLADQTSLMCADAAVTQFPHQSLRSCFPLLALPSLTTSLIPCRTSLGVSSRRSREPIQTGSFPASTPRPSAVSICLLRIFTMLGYL